MFTCSEEKRCRKSIKIAPGNRWDPRRKKENVWTGKKKKNADKTPTHEIKKCEIPHVL